MAHVNVYAHIHVANHGFYLQCFVVVIRLLDVTCFQHVFPLGYLGLNLRIDTAYFLKTKTYMLNQDLHNINTCSGNNDASRDRDRKGTKRSPKRESERETMLPEFSCH